MNTNLECQLRSSTVDDRWCRFQRSYQMGRAVYHQRTGDGGQDIRWCHVMHFAPITLRITTPKSDGLRRRLDGSLVTMKFSVCDDANMYLCIR